MKTKRQNAAMKATARGKARTLQTAEETRIETVLNRALRHVRQMTPAQRRESLVEAGILTREGKLADTYR